MENPLTHYIISVKELKLFKLQKPCVTTVASLKPCMSLKKYICVLNISASSAKRVLLEVILDHFCWSCYQDAVGIFKLWTKEKQEKWSYKVLFQHFCFKLYLTGIITDTPSLIDTKLFFFLMFSCSFYKYIFFFNLFNLPGICKRIIVCHTQWGFSGIHLRFLIAQWQLSA